jgi:hypothetical protein
MKFMTVLGIETLIKCYILKRWHVTIENLVYFHQVIALYIVKTL